MSSVRSRQGPPRHSLEMRRASCRMARMVVASHLRALDVLHQGFLRPENRHAEGDEHDERDRDRRVLQRLRRQFRREIDAGVQDHQGPQSSESVREGCRRESVAGRHEHVQQHILQGARGCCGMSSSLSPTRKSVSAHSRGDKERSEHDAGDVRDEVEAPPGERKMGATVRASMMSPNRAACTVTPKPPTFAWHE